MSYEPTRPAVRRTRSTILVALWIVSAVVGVLILRPLASSSTPASSSPSPGLPIDTPPGNLERARGAGGAVHNGVTIFDDEIPALANLDPDLLDALRKAALDAADDGVEFFVNSGWRSPEYQDQLFREAVSKYGTEEEAARWVAAADTSPHVSGDAIDIGHSDAAAWLSEHGAEYGLCQIYRNEPWHYELRLEAIEHDCPAIYADPTHDPRMATRRRLNFPRSRRDYRPRNPGRGGPEPPPDVPGSGGAGIAPAAPPHMFAIQLQV